MAVEVRPAGMDPHAGPLTGMAAVEAVVLSAVHQARPGGVESWSPMDTIKSVLWGRGEKGALGVADAVLRVLETRGVVERNGVGAVRVAGHGEEFAVAPSAAPGVEDPLGGFDLQRVAAAVAADQQVVRPRRPAR